ncbi:TetR/AcrR family transcriptional regulator [Planosporangium mesophilum]|uniref:TetR family transcriptional regulator n=1 Tax=Planosporangium mesophilum TaxID=689768 RepID=A0A8J3WZF0_9ACTN|nr:TetR/AcrR family transcriptional regulator [Planosporangium mesophilum]NJC81211.1 TetR family transcriptional regulator [Planosporangium mesophilum]GII21139.1 TetR family transcriptional regulator [Planosporangium mesophilum]
MTAASIRARVRAEMTEEIKAAARRHLATDGANLSLRAVARELGMVSSAIYRYFASRDELLTALIVDAYDAVGAAAERAEAGVDRADLLGRWLAACRAVREWALANPHEYALIYGSPVPGYAAPPDTVPPASRVGLLITAILADGFAAGKLAAEQGQPVPQPLRPELAALVGQLVPGVPEPLLARGMTAWIQLFGAVSFELFGQLNNMIEDRGTFFEYQMRTAARVVGLEG